MAGSGARGRRRAAPPRRPPGARKETDESKGSIVGSSSTSFRDEVFPLEGSAFRALLTAKLCSAIWCHITDCDEVFNYWEPIHYLIYGWGLQTWEYSASTALRSYAALWIVGSPSAALASTTFTAPPALFYLTRCLLALSTAIADHQFYNSVSQEFGIHIGRLCLAFCLTGHGGFISGAANLPSAWSCTLSSLALSAWWNRNYPVAVLFTASSTLLGWPFAGLLGLPIAIDMLFIRKQPFVFVKWVVISLLLILVPMIYIDSRYYGQLMIAPWNLIKYNVFTQHGPNLYGTEPWTFYFINGLLSHNIIWISALACPILIILCEFIPHFKPRNALCQPYWLSLMPLYSWLMVFFLQPHKEERFLFPVYSMICLCGAIGVDCVQKLTFHFKTVIKNTLNSLKSKKKSVDVVDKKQLYNQYGSKTNVLMSTIIFLSTILSMSRNVAIYNNYHAPMDILRGLAEEQISTVGNINVCYGKEWHRFPSSFLFPDERYRVAFVKSEFDGMLPAYYASSVDATKLAPDHFNDMNKEDPRLYTNISECHYLVDSTIGDVSYFEPRYSEDTSNWTLVKSLPFLDARKSHRLFRAFYVPFVSGRFNVYGELQLLRSAKLEVN